MFDTFDDTDDTVGGIMAIARIESDRLKHEYIGDEHILLALLAVENNAATDIICGKFGVNRVIIRQQIEKLIGIGFRSSYSTGNRPLTQQAIKTLRVAKEEADLARHGSVGTDHLLLGLLKADGSASEVLRSHNMTSKSVREYIRLSLEKPDTIGEPSGKLMPGEEREKLMAMLLEEGEKIRRGIKAMISIGERLADLPD